MAPCDELPSKCLRLLKPKGGEEAEKETTWKDKPLRCMYYRQIEKVADIEKTYQNRVV